MQDVRFAPSVSTLGHLERCRVEGLFGRRLVDFPTATEGPTLLFGQNGTGKSTILRLIDDVAHGRWAELLDRPFDRLELFFASGSRLAVSKQGDGMTASLDDDWWTLTRDVLRAARRRQHLRRRRLIEAGRPIPFEGQFELFADELGEVPGWASNIARLFPVFHIEDQRLILKPHAMSERQAAAKGRGPEMHSAVRRFPVQLRDEIQLAMSGYAAHSQELDRRFPMKIASAVETEESGGHMGQTDVQGLRDLLGRVAEERTALQKVGLLGREEQPGYFDVRRLEAERVRPVIRAFAEDTLEKFAVLSDLRIRLELFASFLNQHYRDKQVVTRREDGFALLLDDGTSLEPWQLSSGEQQVLALAFQILFGSDPGTLIMIDEPELSLHVLWQSTLIDDLVAMGAARDVTFILATHSPTLVGDRVELMRTLDDVPSVIGPMRADVSNDADDLFDEDDDEGEDEPEDIADLLEADEYPASE